jgi:isopentenyl-diphosphate delta-isomerase
MSEEYFDITDENNNPTGKTALRSEAHTKGFWHRTVHIYLFRQNEENLEFLVHLRSKNKDLHPNNWDTRFGGHLKSGDSVEQALRSELQEEIGLVSEDKNLIKGEVVKAENFPNNEFTYIYYYDFTGNNSELKFNDGEVQDIKWMKADDIIDSMEHNADIWSGSKRGFVSILSVLKSKLI